MKTRSLASNRALFQHGERKGATVILTINSWDVNDFGQ